MNRCEKCNGHGYGPSTGLLESTPVYKDNLCYSHYLFTTETSEEEEDKYYV
jgi:hypothetical protein